MSKQPPKEPPIELEIPGDVPKADQAVELIRAWIADGSLMVSLNAEAFGDRVGDWGRLLSEVSAHIAKAAALQGHMSETEAEAVVRKAFTTAGIVVAGSPQSSGAEGQIRGRTKH
jgi:hypothetical protein